ncbi:UNVERIFIED_CONTAM: Berberine bridge enzyme-like 18 [Sesamum calycinum]|uniref:Berberine bridge enzyme-like 18 n=1 Tax=Sesamum calycinum TaxID=2727403 RepID=A0AAW2Q7C0_9LAMI
MESLDTTCLLLFFANLLVLGASSSQDHNQHFLQCLTDQFRHSNLDPSNVVHTPKDPSYDSLLHTQNRRPASTFPLRPLLITTPYHKREIRAVIYCSKKLGAQIRVRSGGHDYEGLSYTSKAPFVILDLRNFRSISINTKDKTAWVEAGATLGQLYYTIAQHSRTLAFTAGVCPTVGVGGHISGGGYGMMSRKHSLAIDHVIDAKEHNATQLVHRWQYIADRIDENLLLRLFLRSVMSPILGKRTLQASFTSLYLGRVHDLLPIMQEKFPELGLVENDCMEMSWIESILFFAGVRNESLDILLDRKPPRRPYFKGKSDYVKQPIPINGLKGIGKFLHREAEIKAELELSPFGGVLSNYSESETPFPHRAGNIFMIHYGVAWNRPGNSALEKHMNWIRRLYSYMTPYVSKNPRAAYSNYRDLDLGMNNEENTSYEQASVWGLKYFGNNFNRLVHVKSQVDPSYFSETSKAFHLCHCNRRKKFRHWSSYIRPKSLVTE